jgi:methylenetetrahydrofolate dehydrogenase (NADP+) / methenyltetrahydrofolate cyclohydrolase
MALPGPVKDPQLIDGRRIAQEIQAETASGVLALRARGREPHLVALQAGGDPASLVYSTKQAQRFGELGIRYSRVALDANVSLELVLREIERLNADAAVTGILVLQPLPEHLAAERIEEAIDPTKDVEGMSPASLGRLLLGRHTAGPCTALAVMAAIHSTEIPLVGKSAVIIGRSNIVGKPSGLLLLHERVTVTTCHTATRDLAEVTRRADIVVAAAGQPGLVTRDMIGKGAIVIDVGMHRVDGRTVGDVDFEGVRPIASWITPVPGGIGPITVAMLARNTLLCAEAALRG